MFFMGSREDLMADLGRDVSAWQTAVQRFDELAAERMDLHVIDLQVLGFLATEEPLPTGWLAEPAGLSPGQRRRRWTGSRRLATSSDCGRQETENDP